MVPKTDDTSTNINAIIKFILKSNTNEVPVGLIELKIFFPNIIDGIKNKMYATSKIFVDFFMFIFSAK